MEKFSEKIKFDEDAYYMSCPEFVGNYLADRLRNYKSAVELCSAIGMTVIALAKKIDKVYGVELSEERVQMAKYNANLYNVKPNFIVGNALDANILKGINAEVAVLDPDWSLDKENPKSHAISINQTKPNAKELYLAVKENITHNIVLRVSKHFTFETLNELGPCHIENIIYNDCIRFKYAYFSDEISENKEINIIFDEEGNYEIKE